MIRPSILGIARTTALIGIATAAVLELLNSGSVALGCLIGSGFMIANFMLLALVGRGITASAVGAGGPARFALLLIPLKLAFFLGGAYVIVSLIHANIPGFVLGVLTQFVAIFIETWRTAGETESGVAQSPVPTSPAVEMKGEQQGSSLEPS